MQAFWDVLNEGCIVREHVVNAMYVPDACAHRVLSYSVIVACREGMAGG